MSNRTASDTFERCPNCNAQGVCMYIGPCLSCAHHRAHHRAREREHKRRNPQPVQSTCINCNQLRPCLKIEMRAPLDEAVLVWDEETESYGRVEYELHGPMIEICRECADDPIVQRTIITALLEDL